MSDFELQERVDTAAEVLQKILDEHPELYGKIELNYQGGEFVNSNITHAGPRRESKRVKN